MKTFQLSLISFLIFCSLPVKAVGGVGLTSAESCLITICVAPALHACLRRTTPTPMLHTQECTYAAHLRSYYQQSTDGLNPTQVMWYSLFKGSWHECLCEDENRDRDMFIFLRSALWSRAKHQSLLLSACHCQRYRQSGCNKQVLNLRNATPAATG